MQFTELQQIINKLTATYNNLTFQAQFFNSFKFTTNPNTT